MLLCVVRAEMEETAVMIHLPYSYGASSSSQSPNYDALIEERPAILKQVDSRYNTVQRETCIRETTKQLMP
jgi:hypothetical protein